MENKIEVIENNGRTILRENNGNYDFNIWFSSSFIHELENKGIDKKEFFKEKRNLFKLEGKYINIFCLTKYINDDFLILLNNLEKEGHINIKKSDIYVYNNGEF